MDGMRGSSTGGSSGWGKKACNKGESTEKDTTKIEGHLNGSMGP